MAVESVMVTRPAELVTKLNLYGGRVREIIVFDKGMTSVIIAKSGTPGHGVFVTHRAITGAPIAPDAAFPGTLDADDCVDLTGFQQALVAVSFDGGGTVDLQAGIWDEALSAVVALATEAGVVTGGQYLLNVYGGKIYLRVSALSAPTTTLTITVAGAEKA